MTANRAPSPTIDLHVWPCSAIRSGKRDERESFAETPPPLKAHMSRAMNLQCEL